MRRHVLRALTLALLTGCGGSDATSTSSSEPETTVVSLQPTAANGTAAEVSVRASSAQVQFRLAGIDRPSEDLTAELERVGADQIRRWPVVDAPTAADGATHAVMVPIYEVRPGEYVLTVWAGDVEIVRRYRFGVTTSTR